MISEYPRFQLWVLLILLLWSRMNPRSFHSVIWIHRRRSSVLLGVGLVSTGSTCFLGMTLSLLLSFRR